MPLDLPAALLYIGGPVFTGLATHIYAHGGTSAREQQNPARRPTDNETLEHFAMTKSDLIEQIANTAGLTKDKASVVVNAIFDEMVDAMKRGERIEIRNFGNFTVRHYEAYTGRNPKTGESVQVDEKRMPFFKVGLELKRRVNGEI